MKISTLVIIIVSIVLLIIGIYLLYSVLNPNPPVPSDNSTIIQPNTTSVTQQALTSVVDANNQFAFDLYDKYKDNPQYKDKNIFYSPYSISTALAMTYEGARGTTADEMQKVFYFPTDANTRMPAFAKLYSDLNKQDKEYRLSTANALWAEKTYNLLDDYKNTILTYYGGETTNLDFKNNPEPSRVTINNWVEKQTNDKIKDLIPQGIIDSYTRLVLTNAIYFKGTWEWEFDKSDTSEQDFKTTPGNIVKTQMMYMKNDKATFNYAETNNMQILELPYKGNDISMLIILPKESLGAVEPSLTAEKLNEYKAQMKGTKLDAIYLPKFKFDTKYFMVQTLSEMGMPTAFSMQADLSGMDGSKNLYIQNVIHQAFVQVDEEGTEAAAATAVVVGLKSAMPTNIFKADHPFIFLIQDKNSGEILFFGKIENPSE